MDSTTIDTQTAAQPEPYECKHHGLLDEADVYRFPAHSNRRPYCRRCRLSMPSVQARAAGQPRPSRARGSRPSLVVGVRTLTDDAAEAVDIARQQLSSGFAAATPKATLDAVREVLDRAAAGIPAGSRLSRLLAEARAIAGATPTVPDGLPVPARAAAYAGARRDALAAVVGVLTGGEATA